MILYRKISRLFAIVELILMALVVPVLVYCGVLLGYYTFWSTIQDDRLGMKWIFYPMCVVLCYIKLLADVRLIFATSKDVDATSAIQFCQLWLVIYSISLAFCLMLLIALLANNVYKTESVAFCLYCAFVLLRVFTLHCVKNYKRELKDFLVCSSTYPQRNNESLRLPRRTAEQQERGISHSSSIITETRMPFIPMSVIHAAGLPVAPISNSTDDLPTYDDLTLEINIDPSPPPYHEIIHSEK